MADCIQGQTSAELSGWIAYYKLEDELQTRRIARAITMAFGAGNKPAQPQPIDDDGDVIDTTAPEFTQNFKGFINRPTPNPVQQRRFGNTEIKMG